MLLRCPMVDPTLVAVAEVVLPAILAVVVVVLVLGLLLAVAVLGRQWLSYQVPVPLALLRRC